MASTRAQRLLQFSHHRPQIYHFERIDACPSTSFQSKTLLTTTTISSSPKSNHLRPFTTTSPHGARPATAGAARASKARAGKAQPSPGLMQKEQMKRMMKDGSAFQAMGLAPETFTTLPLRDRPSFLTDFSTRWLWEKTRLQKRAKQLFALLYFKFWAVRTRSPDAVARLGTNARLRYRLFEWYDFELFRTPRIARELYEEMYRALASGELDGVAGKVKGDLLGSLRGRVEARGKLNSTEWKLVRYTKRPRCVGYSVIMPNPDSKEPWSQSWLQQAVVEVESLQSVKRIRRVPDGKGGYEFRDVSGGAKDREGWPVPRTVREYVVIQKSVVEGRQGRWMLWGMTKPTTVLDVKRELREKLGLPEGQA
ncbi:hypothetical protein C1H76_4641 [Elsinoe australis]|uniref:Uncharacterized protein n=1 Tax=Elsinoe australis TaxID=40998 RepID=A0A4U7AX21_9PEZI|nr:hypothetical protein C1H76_4641 [Elsinoe australis]